MTKEKQEQIVEEEVIEEPRITHIKCKPTYAFQSIEFEWDLTDENFEEMILLYSRLVEALKDIAPEQPDSNKKPAKKGPAATPSQLALLDKLKVKHAKDITAKEASVLIDKYFEERE